MKLLTYRDLKDENRRGYELNGVLKPGVMVLKEQIIPGLYGFSPIYVRHIRFLWGGGDVVLIVSQTNDELDHLKRAQIVKGARMFLTGLDR